MSRRTATVITLSLALGLMTCAALVGFDHAIIQPRIMAADQQPAPMWQYAAPVIQVSEDGGQWCDYPQRCDPRLQWSYVRVLLDRDNPIKRRATDLLIVGR